MAVVKDVAAIKPEFFDLAAQVEQPAKSFFAQNELDPPAQTVVGLRDPRMTRHVPRSPINGSKPHACHSDEGAISASPARR
jgi:hypothetical protein